MSKNLVQTAVQWTKMHGLNLIANCSSSTKKWQMTLVRQNNDRLYVAVWSAKFDLSRMKYLTEKAWSVGENFCVCYMILDGIVHECYLASVIFWLKTVVITGVSGHLLKWNQCVHYHHHTSCIFLTTGLESVRPDSLCDIPQYLQCHDHSPSAPWPTHLHPPQFKGCELS